MYVYIIWHMYVYMMHLASAWDNGRGGEGGGEEAILWGESRCMIVLTFA